MLDAHLANSMKALNVDSAPHWGQHADVMGQECCIRVSTTPVSPGNLLEFINPPGNLLEFNWSSWKFLCKMSKIDRIGFQS